MKTNMERIQIRLFAAGLLMLAAAVVVASCKKDDDKNDPAPTGATQIDRMAVPAINTALISSASKDSFNRGDPSTDIALFQGQMGSNIDGLRTAVDGISGFPAQDVPGVTTAQLLAIVCPDVVSINFANPVTFPNGRQLSDDVMDPILGLVLNRNTAGGGISDTINTNDAAFSGTFPYLANPWP